MYKISLLKQSVGRTEAVKEYRTETESWEIARVVFWHLRNKNYDARYLLLMHKDKIQINAYRYCSIESDPDYIGSIDDLKNLM